jgi:hypothetical protein
VAAAVNPDISLGFAPPRYNPHEISGLIRYDYADLREMNMENNDYHICLVYLPTNAGVKYPLIFMEIITLLFHSFAALGRVCTFKANKLEKEKTNIIIGNVMTNPDLPEFLAGNKYILYQLEQLSDTEGWYSRFSLFRNILQNSSEIWDYSVNNIEFLKARNINARLLPLGYNKNLENIINAEKDIDVFFYGSIKERRLQILRKLDARGLNVKSLSNIYGRERDQYIARAKIVLNIHYFDTAVFESARIHYLLNNKIFVVTEQSVDNPYEKVDLVCVPYEQLADECVKRLADWGNSQKLAELNYEQFKKHYPMVRFLKNIV